MELSSKAANQQIIGGLMHNTLLFLEYSDILPNDFEKEAKSARVCFMTIKRLYEHGAVKLTPIEVDQEVERCGGASASEYKKDGGLDFLKKAYEFATPENFGVYYARLKKYSLLVKIIQLNNCIIFTF